MAMASKRSDVFPRVTKAGSNTVKIIRIPITQLEKSGWAQGNVGRKVGGTHTHFSKLHRSTK